MSFLKPGAGAQAAPSVAPATLPAPSNPMANGLGHLFGTDEARVSRIADRIGNGMNMIAAGGGAQPGYARPAGYAQPEAAPQGEVTNHLQLLDPDVLKALVARFRPSATGVQY